MDVSISYTIVFCAKNTIVRVAHRRFYRVLDRYIICADLIVRARKVFMGHNSKFSRGILLHVRTGAAGPIFREASCYFAVKKLCTPDFTAACPCNSLSVVEKFLHRRRYEGVYISRAIGHPRNSAMKLRRFSRLLFLRL